MEKVIDFYEVISIALIATILGFLFILCIKDSINRNDKYKEDETE